MNRRSVEDLDLETTDSDRNEQSGEQTPLSERPPPSYDEVVFARRRGNDADDDAYNSSFVSVHSQDPNQSFASGTGSYLSGGERPRKDESFYSSISGPRSNQEDLNISLGSYWDESNQPRSDDLNRSTASTRADGYDPGECYELDYTPSVDEPRNSSMRHVEPIPLETFSEPPIARTSSTTVQSRPDVYNFDVEENRESNESSPGGSPFRKLLWRIRNVKEDPHRLKLVLLIIAIIVFVFLFILFCFSWVAIEYTQLGLKKSKLTGIVYEDETVYPGCYLLGPDIEFKMFSSTVHFVTFTKMKIYLSDKLPIEVTMNVGIQLRPEDIGKLHKLYDMDYENVLELLTFSTLKNTLISFSTVDMRHNRKFVEQTLHTAVQKKLGGSCCAQCCQKECVGSIICSSCDAGSNCSAGYFVDAMYFYMERVDLPDEIESLLLKPVLLNEQFETEKYIQMKKLEDIETKRQVQKLKNDANEILESARAQKILIDSKAEAKAEAIRSMADLSGISGMCKNFSITSQNHKMSMYYIRSLDNMEELYAAPDFVKTTISQWNLFKIK